MGFLVLKQHVSGNNGFLFLQLTDALPEAFFNEECANGTVKPSDPVQFTCKLNEAVLLRVMLPTGDQETISIGDTAADIALTPGFTAVSLNITEIDNILRNFRLVLLIDHAYLLEGGEIICDDSTSKNKAMAGCPIGKFSSPSIFTNTYSKILNA